MNYTLAVQVGDSLHELLEELLDFVLVDEARTWLLADVLVEVAAVDVLHHERHLGASVDGVVKLHYARVTQRAQEVDFSLQGSHSGYILSQLALHVLLDSHLLFGFTVVRSLHLGICALSQQHLHLIVA